MRTLLAATLLGGAFYSAPILPTADAQTGAANCSGGRCIQQRYLASRSMSVVSYEGREHPCVEWVANPAPGVFTLKKDGSETYSRGDLTNAPVQVIGIYKDEGINFYTMKRAATGMLFYTYLAGMPVKKTYDSDGCLQELSYERAVFELDVGTNRLAPDRMTVNRRADGLFAIRFVNEMNGQNKEISRYVYQRTDDYRLTSQLSETRVDAIPETNTFVPGLGATIVRRRRGSSNSFNVVDKQDFCIIATSDDQYLMLTDCREGSDIFTASAPD